MARKREQDVLKKLKAIFKEIQEGEDVEIDEAFAKEVFETIAKRKALSRKKEKTVFDIFNTVNRLQEASREVLKSESPSTLASFLKTVRESARVDSKLVSKLLGIERREYETLEKISTPIISLRMAKIVSKIIVWFKVSFEQIQNFFPSPLENFGFEGIVPSSGGAVAHIGEEEEQFAPDTHSIYEEIPKEVFFDHIKKELKDMGWE